MNSISIVFSQKRRDRTRDFVRVGGVYSEPVRSDSILLLFELWKKDNLELPFWPDVLVTHTHTQPNRGLVPFSLLGCSPDAYTKCILMVREGD